MDNHPIDEWDEQSKAANAKATADAIRDSALIYSVFDSPHGRKLIELWTRALIEVPTARVGYDTLTIGIAEGKKEFVRSILTAIKITEASQ